MCASLLRLRGWNPNCTRVPRPGKILLIPLVFKLLPPPTHPPTRRQNLLKKTHLEHHETRSELIVKNDQLEALVIRLESERDALAAKARLYVLPASLCVRVWVCVCARVCVPCECVPCEWGGDRGREESDVGDLLLLTATTAGLIVCYARVVPLSVVVLFQATSVGDGVCPSALVSLSPPLLATSTSQTSAIPRHGWSGGGTGIRP